MRTGHLKIKTLSLRLDRDQQLFAYSDRQQLTEKNIVIRNVIIPIKRIIRSEQREPCRLVVLGSIAQLVVQVVRVDDCCLRIMCCVGKRALMKLPTSGSDGASKSVSSYNNQPLEDNELLLIAETNCEKAIIHAKKELYSWLFLSMIPCLLRRKRLSARTK